MGSHRAGSSGGGSSAETGDRSFHVGSRGHRLPQFERKPARSRGHRRAQVVVRGGVLASLLTATVVIPVSQGALSIGVLGQVELPSTVSALSAQSIGGQVPAALAPAGTVVERDLEAASRGLERGKLPGCEGLAPTKLASNGNMPERDLCTLWDGKTKLRADYAVALAELNQAYVARFGVDLCVSDGYRSLTQQYATKRSKGYLAATPGTSNHGLGLAVDFCPTTYAGNRYQWLRDNAPKYDIDNPDWARKQKHEPWHWEFMTAVARDNSINGNTASGR